MTAGFNSVPVLSHTGIHASSYRWQETVKNRGGKFTWASHVESHHTCLSGGFFLEALAAEPQPLLTAAAELQPLVAHVLTGTTEVPVALEPKSTIAIAGYIEGRVVHTCWLSWYILS